MEGWSAMMSKTTIERYKRGIQARIAKVRGRRSQRTFARELGVSWQKVNGYENGQIPRADFLITIAINEGISIDWLLLGRGRARRR